MSRKAIALGTFDGLHIGHTAVLNRIKNKNFSSVALTFEIPPKAVGEEKSSLLMTPEDKAEMLRKQGIEPEIMDFLTVKDISPIDFLKFVKEKYDPVLIASGFNFRFGRNAAGSCGLLKAFCDEQKIEYYCADAVMLNGKTVSSTRIRDMISRGNIKSATEMLGRYFSFETPIIHGDQRGRTIGFPTINQAYPEILVSPRFGVYASITEIEGKSYRSVTNIGIRPTYETDYIISETHIFDYNADAYEKQARVYLTDFIRDEVRFNSLEELKNAIERDKNVAQNVSDLTDMLQ